MKYIKLFEAFGEKYIENSIKDILIELQDMGMLVDMWHWDPKINKLGIHITKEYYSISIKGVLDKVVDYGMHGTLTDYKSFNTNLIKDYVDTVIDFMSEFCPDFDVYFEYYDGSQESLGESKELLENKNVVEVEFRFIKRK